MKPVATDLIDPADVPACPDCGHRRWLATSTHLLCLDCPTGLLPKGDA